MHFKTLLLAGLAAAQCPPRNPDGFAAGDELAAWVHEGVYDFFPYQEGWEVAFDQWFSRDLTATFNSTQLDFDGLRALFAQVYPGLSDGFGGTFVHGFLSTVAVPNANDKGGLIYLTGWEGGFLGGDESKPVNVTDAAFGVVAETEDCNEILVNAGGVACTSGVGTRGS